METDLSGVRGAAVADTGVAAIAMPIKTGSACVQNATTKCLITEGRLALTGPVLVVALR